MKKVLALTLAALLTISLFAGCSTGQTQPSATPVVQSTAPAATAEPTENAVQELPLVDEPVTFTAWWSLSPPPTIKGFEENQVFVEMAKLTNVSIQFTSATQGSAQEQFNLLIASQEYTDFMTGFSQLYNRGFDAAIADQIILPLEDMLTFMPNIKATRENDDEIRKQTTTDSGHMPGIPFVLVDQNGDAQGSWLGTVVRQDWLDTMGMAVPTTYDEMDKVLAAMKENYPAAANPLWLFAKGFSLATGLTAGYDTTNGFYQVDGKAKFGAVEPGFREYLEMLAGWYAKGYISSDFTAKSPMPWGDVAEVSNDKYGVFDMIYTWNGTYKSAAIDPNFKLTAIPALVKNKGDKTHLRMYASKANTGGCISATTDKAELICRYWDYLFSDEGKILSNYGVEGVTLKYVDDKPQWMGPMMNESKAADFNLSNAQFQYLLFNSAGYILYDREFQAVDEAAKAYVNTWNIDGYDHVYSSSATLTAEEGNEFSSIMGDINTFIDENIVKYITGAKSFDKYDDEFVNQLKAMGTDRAIELKQAALDRYNNR